MTVPTNEASEVRNAKWTFTMNVTTGTLTVDHPSVGRLNVLKIELIDYGTRTSIVCSGRTHNGPPNLAMRSARFNLHGYQAPLAPEHLLEFLRKHAFPRTEP